MKFKIKGLLNPCPAKSKLIPGVNNYFPHLFPNRYLHCDFDGRAFARSCAPGLKWKQEALSCLPDNFGVEATNSFSAGANKTNKLMKNKENTVERKTVVVPKMMQPLTSNQDQEPIRPVQRESNNSSSAAPRLRPIYFLKESSKKICILRSGASML